MTTMQHVALIAATVTASLTAGVFFAFAVAVMPGLARLDDSGFTMAMRHVNEAILNRWFLGCFTGAVPLGLLAVVLTWVTGPGAVTWWSLAALALYLVCFGITAGVNVPLNNALRDAGDEDPAGVRAAFEPAWNRWHLIRTVAVVASLVAWCVALTVHGG
ncbi:putative membrane protein [Stackebrandtia albiflava]|uniref:Putative membrane protein n=1 Tax=Stackebrandtia albiflava TaxID=406432 RepID=A0A562UYF2_9ACTN|nr:anthrone oxygenase family protein [Stackebrandtia albiflava]TWJ10636.1 putative membrane protein [Stackebrandtia albiflava]